MDETPADAAPEAAAAAPPAPPVEPPVIEQEAFSSDEHGAFRAHLDTIADDIPCVARVVQEFSVRLIHAGGQLAHFVAGQRIEGKTAYELLHTNPGNVTQDE